MTNDESVRRGWIGFSEADDGHGQRVGDNAFQFVLSIVPSVNRVDGISEIEGKAAKGSGERVGKGASFKSVVLILLFVSIRVNLSAVADSWLMVSRGEGLGLD